MEKITKYNFLEEAESRYPQGTIFTAAHVVELEDTQFIVTSETTFEFESENIYLIDKNTRKRMPNSVGFLPLIYYTNGSKSRWAKIKGNTINEELEEIRKFIYKD